MLCGGLSAVQDGIDTGRYISVQNIFIVADHLNQHCKGGCLTPLLLGFPAIITSAQEQQHVARAA